MKIVFFDTETSGLKFEEGARILSCSAYTYPVKDESRLVKHTWTLNWGIDIPEEASKVNGLTREYLEKHGRTDTTQALREMYDVIFGAYTIVAYNLPFDMSMLHSHWKEYSKFYREYVEKSRRKQFVDPLVIDKALDPFRKGKRTLMATAKHYGVKVDEDKLHDASYDVEVLMDVYKAVVNRYVAMGHDMSVIKSFQTTHKASQARGLQSYFRRQGRDEYVDPGFPIYNHLEEVK